MTPISWFQILTAASCATALCLAGCGGSRDGGGDPAAGPGRGDTPRISTVRDSRPAGVADASRAGRSSARSADDAALQAGAGPGKTLFTGRVTMADASALDTTVTVTVTPTRGTMAHYEEDEPTTAAVGNDGLYRVAIDSPFCAAIRVDGDGLLTLRVSVISDPSGLVHETPPVVVRDFRMERGASVSGRLVDTDGNRLHGTVTARWDGTPVLEERDRVTVSMLPETVCEAGAEAGFRLFARPGEVTLTANSEGFGPVRRTVTAPAGDVELRLGDGATVEGAVLMRGNGEAVSSASVSLEPGFQRPSGLPTSEPVAVSDDLGRFRIRGVQDGAYSIAARAGELGPWRGPDALTRLTIRDGASTSGLILHVFPGYTVSGRVTDRDTSAPLEGVAVGFPWLPKATGTSGADGRFRVERIMAAPPRMFLEVSKDGFQLPGDTLYPIGCLVNFPLGEDLHVTRDLEMVRVMTIAGKVRQANGDGIPGAQIVTMSPDGSLSGFPKACAVDGSFEVEVMPETSVILVAKAPGYAVGRSEVLRVDRAPLTGVVVTLGPGGTLAGMVVDPEGNPVDEATVNATGIPGSDTASIGGRIGSAVTDAQGRFTLRNMPPGALSLSADKKGFADSHPAQVSVTENGTRDDLRLVLRNGHYIAGRVQDQDGSPVVGAEIWAGGGTLTHRLATSGPNGRYRMEDLPGEVLQVSCSVPGVAQEMRKTGVAVDSDNVDFVLKMDERDDTVIVTGMVLDWRTREPLSEFTVTPAARGLEKNTGRPGEFRMPAKTGEYHRIVVAAAGCVECEQAVEIPKGATKGPDLEFLMGPGGTVTGRVVSKGDKAPLRGLRVGVGRTWSNAESIPNGRDNVATTGADGRFTIAGLPVGPNLVVVAVPEGRVPTGKELQLKHGAVTDAGDIAVGSGGTIRARVVRLPKETPVEGIVVSTSRSPSSAFMRRATKSTDADGVALFPNLEAGVYRLHTADPAFSTYAAVDEDGVTDVVIRLGGATLRGRVTLDGRPVASGSVALNGHPSKGRLVYECLVGGDGCYEITGVPEGDYKATASGEWTPDGLTPHAEANLQIRGSGEQVHDFVLPSGRLVGRVVDHSDNPVPRARITVSAADPHAAYARTLGGSRGFNSGEEGEFVVRGLAGGAYNVSALKMGLGTAPQQTVEVPQDGESRRVTLRLESGQTGTVVSMALDYATGRPLPDAVCFLKAEDGPSPDHGATRGRDGVMTIPDVPAGRYVAWVTAQWYSSGHHNIEVKPGETVRVEDVLHEVGAVRWTLTTPDGAPVAGAQCTITPDDPASIESPRSGVTAAHGIWGVPGGLLPGSYTATATAPGRQPARARMDVRAGELTEVITSME